jgi:hypothetical protein
MKKVELTKEEKAKLPQELQEALDDGSAVAIPVPKPIMSGRWFAVIAAIMVAVALAPFFTPVTTGMAVVNGFVALAWLIAFKIADTAATQYKLSRDTAMAIADGMFAIIDKALKEREETTRVTPQDLGSDYVGGPQIIDSKEDLDGTSEE